MSTKSTIAHGDGFHFYAEALDEENVYLELTGVEYEARPNCVMVQIPTAIFETIRQHQVARLDLIGKSDEELRQQAQQSVNDRLAHVRAAQEKHGRPGIAAIFGLGMYGAAEDPVEQQIATGLRHLKAARERQENLKKKIEELTGVAYEKGLERQPEVP
jgi:hypothetical protein